MEVLALAEGDGFAEQRSEPAAIDTLLDTPDTTVATAETARRAQSDLESTKYDIPIPLNDRVLSYVELFSGRLKDYLEGGLSRGSRYLPDRRDLNRFFPGTTYGSAASRIAYALFRKLVVHCDALVDFHTGSFDRANLPQVRGDLTLPSVLEFTRGFGAAPVLHSPGARGMLRS